MNHKYKHSEKEKIAKEGRVGRECFNCKGMYLFTMLLLITLVLQCLNNNVEANVVHRSKKTLKLFQSSSSLIQLRHKRDTFANEYLQQQQQQQGQDAFVREGINYYENVDAKDEEDNDYDNNYEVLPDMFASYQPPTVGDQISETAKRVAQSFTDMWQSLTDSIQHCLAGLRAMFGDDGGFGAQDMTPEQAERLRVAMEQQYRVDHEHDNDVFWHVYENKL